MEEVKKINNIKQDVFFKKNLQEVSKSISVSLNFDPIEKELWCMESFFIFEKNSLTFFRCLTTPSCCLELLLDRKRWTSKKRNKFFTSKFLSKNLIGQNIMSYKNKKDWKRYTENRLFNTVQPQRVVCFVL